MHDARHVSTQRRMVLSYVVSLRVIEKLVKANVKHMWLLHANILELVIRVTRGTWTKKNMGPFIPMMFTELIIWPSISHSSGKIMLFAWYSC